MIRYKKSFQNKVLKCEFHNGTFWVDVQGETDTYHVSIKIGDECRFSGVKGIANGQLCSHQITALRHLANRAVIENIYKNA